LDYAETLSWTTKHFGKVQAQTYSETISKAIQALTDGPEILGNKLRDEIELGIYCCGELSAQFETNTQTPSG